MRGRRFTLAVAGLLALGLGAAYSNSLDVGFHFDDAYGIAHNPAIRSLRNVPRFFVDPFTLTTVRENVDVRPVLQTTYALNYAVSRLEPWSYHALNLLLHWIGALLVFLLVRDRLWWPREERGPAGDARWPAAAAALLFALAPLQTQTLDYLWARSALLSTTLYLGAFAAFLAGRRFAGALLFAGALGTKTVAATLPAVLLLHDLVYRDRARRPTLRSWLREWRPLVRVAALPVALVAAYMAYRWTLLPRWAESTRHEAWVTPWTWFMSQWPALLQYVRLFVWPDVLSVDHALPYVESPAEPRAWLSLAALLAWIGAAAWGARRRPLVAFATGWFFLVLAPESSFLALAEVINDHRPYLASSLGLAPLAAWLLRAGAARLGRVGRPAAAGVCVALCGAAVAATRQRNEQWREPTTLWLDAARKNPGNARAWMNAGQALLTRGALAEARRYLERARDLAPGYPYVHMNLAALAIREGRNAQGYEAATAAVRTGAHLASSHYYQGEALRRLRRTKEAAAAFRRALAIDPRHGESRAALAAMGEGEPDESPEAQMEAGLFARYTLGDAAKAAGHFAKVLEKNPAHYGATFQLAAALDAAGQPGRARPHWEKVLEMALRFGDADVVRTARERLARTP